MSLVLGVLLIGCSALPARGASPPAASPPDHAMENPGTLIQEVRAEPYLFLSFYNEEEFNPSFVILRDGVPILADSGIGNDDYFQVVSPGAAAEDAPEKTPVVRDITGDGIRDLIIRYYSGGAHCCYTYRIFSLGPEFREIAMLEGGHADFAFVDPDGKGVYLLESYDTTFAYWKTCYACSPAMPVVLEFADGGYRLAVERMRKGAPTEEEIVARLDEIRRQFAAGEDDLEVMRSAEGVPVVLWEFLLELIYTGHGDLAWRVFDRAWPAGWPGKVEFLGEFREQLAASHYWPGLKRLNGWP